MGFTKEILRAGNGVKPKRGQNVTVHCTGYGKNRDLSQKFWSTKDPGQEPFTFAVGTGSGKCDVCVFVVLLPVASSMNCLSYACPS